MGEAVCGSGEVTGRAMAPDCVCERCLRTVPLSIWACRTWSNTGGGAHPAGRSGGYRVYTVAELSPRQTKHHCLVRQVRCPAGRSGSSSLALGGAHQRHGEVIGDLPSEALLALVWAW
jgi:hypothetical protein